MAPRNSTTLVALSSLLVAGIITLPGCGREQGHSTLSFTTSKISITCSPPKIIPKIRREFGPSLRGTFELQAVVQIDAQQGRRLDFRKIEQFEKLKIKTESFVDGSSELWPKTRPSTHLRGQWSQVTPQTESVVFGSKDFQVYANLMDPNLVGPRKSRPEWSMIEMRSVDAGEATEIYLGLCVHSPKAID